MNRRGFLSRMVAGAAAVAGVAAAPKLAAASEQDRVQALVDDVLANPGKHPEIEARARALTGETLVLGDDARLENTALPEGTSVVIRGERVVFQNNTLTGGGIELASMSKDILISGNVIRST